MIQKTRYTYLFEIEDSQASSKFRHTIETEDLDCRILGEATFLWDFSSRDTGSCHRTLKQKHGVSGSVRWIPLPCWERTIDPN